MSVQLESTKETQSDRRTLSRRTFLRWGAQVAGSVVILTAARLPPAPVVRAAAGQGTYGSGTYGQGIYVGQPLNTIYLPSVAKGES